MGKEDVDKVVEFGSAWESSITIDGLCYSLDGACREGRNRLEEGRMEEAEAIFRRILTLHPVHADSMHLLGYSAYQNGKRDLAIEYLGNAITLQPGEAHYHNTLGNALRDFGRLEDAMVQLRLALRLRPGSPEINSNLGNVLKDLGRLEEAVARFRTAWRLRPDCPDISYNLANALRDFGCWQEAEAFYRKTLDLRPDFADAHYNLGNMLMALCRLEEAKACYIAALHLRPDSPQAYNNLGNVFHELNRLKAAEVCYHASLRLKPDSPETHYNLGSALVAQNKIHEAAECYRRALALKPDYGAARFARCMAQLPILYADEPEILRRRFAYENCLRRLSDEVEHQKTFSDLAEGVGASQPFYLAYQGHEDRKLQSLYGSVVCRIMAKKYPLFLLKPPPAPAQKVRVGIVSGFFEQHTVWRLLIDGWLTQLDRRQFEIYGYHTGIRQDAMTRIANGLCDRFVQGRLSGHRWRETILADGPHVLIYPEIGMDPMAAQLAAQRLAPVQCCSWGHPETSGFPTIDYFLSSELMEPLNGQDHYSERLIRLPNLSTYYEPKDWRPVPMRRSELGLRPTATVYWSGQSLYKYLPQFDRVFPLIAREVGDCQFVFIEYARSPNVTDLFIRRLERAFAAFGLEANDHCVILPYLEPNRFIASVGLCDIVLDTIGWSGGLSTLDCLTQDLPIVTMTGPLMRSRHTAAILNRMDAAETVSDSVDGYVSTAIRLAHDAAWNAAIKGKIRKNRHRLYLDRTYICALEKFLNLVARGRIVG